MHWVLEGEHSKKWEHLIGMEFLVRVTRVARDRFKREQALL